MVLSLYWCAYQHVDDAFPSLEKQAPRVQELFLSCDWNVKLVNILSEMASLIAQLVKHLPAMQETWVGSLGWEDPLEKEKATLSRILAWRIP